MSDHAGFGWVLLVLGLVIAGVGLVWILAPSIPWLGRLPGDIRIERENFRFYFPLVTCLLLSLLLSLVLWLVRRFRGGDRIRRRVVPGLTKVEQAGTDPLLAIGRRALFVRAPKGGLASASSSHASFDGCSTKGLLLRKLEGAPPGCRRRCGRRRPGLPRRQVRGR
jgi:hypothetical protein